MVEALLLIALLTPLAVLVHELGHGIAALCLQRGPVLVLVGNAPMVTVRMGRLTIAAGVSRSGSGQCAADIRDPLPYVAATAAGPVASLVAALLAAKAGLAIFAFLNGWNALLSIWPWAGWHNGEPERSDGRVIAECFGLLGPPRPRPKLTGKGWVRDRVLLLGTALAISAPMVWIAVSAP